MELDLNMLKPQERVSLQLRLLYEKAGFRQYHMGRFEEYGLYQENRRFLSSEQVITFTDLDGRLLVQVHGINSFEARSYPIRPGDRKTFTARQKNPPWNRPGREESLQKPDAGCKIPVSGCGFGSVFVQITEFYLLPNYRFTLLIK